MKTMRRFTVAVLLLIWGAVGLVSAGETRFLLQKSTGETTGMFFTRVETGDYTTGNDITHVWPTGECIGAANGLPPAGQNLSFLVFHNTTGTVSHSRVLPGHAWWSTTQPGQGFLRYSATLLASQDAGTSCAIGPDPGAVDYYVRVGDHWFTSSDVRPLVVGWSNTQGRVDLQLQAIPSGRSVTCTATPPSVGDMLSARLFGSAVVSIKQEADFVAEVMMVDGRKVVVIRSFATSFTCTDIGGPEPPLFRNSFED